MTNTNNNQLITDFQFCSPVYFIDNPDFLKVVKQVAKEHLDKIKEKIQLDDVFPVYMSDNMLSDERLSLFSTFIAQTCWNILDSQGYDMRYFGTHIRELWAQEHHKRSGNEEHVHGFDTQMTGFFILDAPSKTSSMIAVCDPRPAKRQINLPIKESSELNYAHLFAYYKPEPGRFYFMNSSLPHEFTRHGSDYPITFIHFNVAVHPVNPEDSDKQNEESKIITEVV